MASLDQLQNRYFEHLMAADRRAATRLIVDHVQARPESIADVYLQVFQPAQRRLGELWEHNEITVATEHLCTAITQSVMAQLYSFIFGSPRRGFTLLATCLEDELHEIGLRMVADLFELHGWDTHYLGANCPVDAVVDAVRDRKPHVLAVSVTLPHHIAEVGDLLDGVRALGDAAPRTLVGGYAFVVDPGLAARVGADATANDALHAVEVAERLVGGRR